jgi:hypothetical protein
VSKCRAASQTDASRHSAQHYARPEIRTGGETDGASMMDQ